ncbi:hypothetical protein F7725_006434 [Dissostichus mawsoni]|uniref:ZP domain-containing protein n=1 Tax=Dissostichus mawsoni TaxID=36200 RepID=A0A7J5XTZ6_DISMA|nr:hypothetical protein F7725_006434 [Dissostichus mawsoni]
MITVVLLFPLVFLFVFSSSPFHISINGSSHDSGALEAQVGLEVLSDLPHQALEGQLADQQLGGFLVAADLPQSHGFFTPPVAGALLRAALVASCFLGAFPPVDLRAVCLVLAIVVFQCSQREKECCVSVSSGFMKELPEQGSADWCRLGDTLRCSCFTIGQSVVLLVYQQQSLLGAGVLGHGLGALRHGVLGQLSGEQQADGGLDLPGGDGGALVVVSQTGGLPGDALKDVAHEAVHDAHGLGGDAGVGLSFLDFLLFLPVLVAVFVTAFLEPFLGAFTLAASGMITVAASQMELSGAAPAPEAPVVCTVTGSTVIGFHGAVHSVQDRCAYSLMEPEGSASFNLMAGFRERRRTDVPLLDHLILSLPDVTMYLEQGGRAGVTAKLPNSNMTLYFDGNTAHVSGNEAMEGLCGRPLNSSWTTTPIAEKSSSFSPPGCEIQQQDTIDSSINCNSSTDHCNLMRQPPFSACHNHSDPEPFISACTHTLCRYPSVDGVDCHFLEAYAKACSLEANVTLEDWRSTSGCSPPLSVSSPAVIMSSVEQRCGRHLAASVGLGSPPSEPPVCRQGSATLTLAGCLLDDKGIDFSTLHLKEPRCKGHMDPQSHLKNSNQIVYENSIVSSNRSSGGVITRQDQLKIDFSCLYKQPEVKSVSFTIRDSSVVQQIISGVWNYTLTMNAFNDAGLLKNVGPKTAIQLNQKVWLQLEAGGLDANMVAIVTDSCWATNQASPDDSLRYDLIINGCPNPADDTVQMQGNGQGTSSVFSFAMFEFSGGSSEIYLHCKLELCPTQGRACTPWVALKRAVVLLVYQQQSLLGAGVLGHGLGALRHGVLGQLSGEQQADGGLDLPGGDGGALVVVSQTGGLPGDALKDVAHEAVHDAHGLGGDAAFFAGLAALALTTFFTAFLGVTTFFGVAAFLGVATFLGEAAFLTIFFFGLFVAFFTGVFLAAAAAGFVAFLGVATFAFLAAGFFAAGFVALAAGFFAVFLGFSAGLAALKDPSHDSGALEAQVGLEVLSDLPHQALEGQLADQQLGGLLVAADLPQSHGTGPVTVRFLHAAGGRGALTGSLGGQLLPGSLSSGGFTGGLLGSGHCSFSVFTARERVLCVCEQRLYEGAAGAGQR